MTYQNSKTMGFISWVRKIWNATATAIETCHIVADKLISHVWLCTKSPQLLVIDLSHKVRFWKKKSKKLFIFLAGWSQKKPGLKFTKKIPKQPQTGSWSQSRFIFSFGWGVMPLHFSWTCSKIVRLLDIFFSNFSDQVKPKYC